MEKVAVLMAARSWSGKSQPGIRPVKAAFVPRIYSVQSSLLSPIQRPAEFFFTMRLTRGGALEMAGLTGGLKTAPLFGGGFCPAEGALEKFTAFARGKPTLLPVPMMV